MKPFHLALVALAACEPQYAYVPVTNATVVAGHVAANYPIPKESPRGDVRLASYGITDLGSARDHADRVRALHLRVTLIDNGEKPWTMDTREQIVELDGFGRSVAAFASANAGSPPPAITVPAMGKRVVDLFFPIPPALARAARLPSFDVVWKLRADDVSVAERTPFERISVEPPATYDPIYDYGADYYWGPPYFYDPLYADRGFDRSAARYAGQPLWIQRSSSAAQFTPRARR